MQSDACLAARRHSHFDPSGFAHRIVSNTLALMTWPRVVLVAVVASVAIVLVSRTVARRRLIKRMEGALACVQLGLYHRLSKVYVHEFDADTAKRLAASVVNLLFGSPNSEFAQENHALVEQRLLDLASLPHATRSIVTDAFRTKTMLLYMRYGQQLNRHDEYQRMLANGAIQKGILLPSDQPPSTTEFPVTAKAFLRESLPPLGDSTP